MPEIPPSKKNELLPEVRQGSDSTVRSLPFDSGEFWRRRYRNGGNSGAGSYNRLAGFKAGVINEFVAENGVEKVIEFGCGDGNQLSLANYPEYVGLDVAVEAIELCERRFSNDPSKQFQVLENWEGGVSELVLSLDVIFHLIEDTIYERYMRMLFETSTKFVIIYSSDDESLNEVTKGAHVRHRNFTAWISRNRPNWQLVKRVPNAFPFDANNQTQTSFCEFFIYTKTE